MLSIGQLFIKCYYLFYELSIDRIPYHIESEKRILEWFLNMINKDKAKIITQIILFVVIGIIIPILIDFFVFGNTMKSNIGNEAWAGFLGSYIGGLCTMAAVFITLSYNERQRIQQKADQSESEKNRIRLSIRPYLDTTCSVFDEKINVGVNDKVFRIVDGQSPVRSHISEAKKQGIGYERKEGINDTVYVNYIIRNIGAGSAVDMQLNINQYCENMSLAKDETVQVLSIIEGNIEPINISLFYNDVEQLGYYQKDDRISIIEQNGEKYPLITHIKPQSVIQPAKTI